MVGKFREPARLAGLAIVAGVGDEDVVALVAADPQGLVARGTKATLQGVDMQISNVQGIPRRYWVAGVESLAGMSFPTAGPGLSMTFITHRGRADLGFTTCPDSITDPEHLAARIREGFDEVAALGE